MHFPNFADVDNLISDLALLSYADFAEKVPYYITDCVNEFPTLTPNQTYHLDKVNACGAWALEDGTG